MHWSTDLSISADLEQVGEQEPFYYLKSAETGRLMELVRRVAPQDTTLLLNGETGTGKSRLARLIHEMSPRANQPFLVVHLGVLAPSLIESEMFGHLKGAFTGADRDRPGKFAEVGGGTLLLDEIDSLPLLLQCKLLRAVEERLFEPVGSNKTQTVQARIIAASNRDLSREVEAGRFRPDLYYRLNVVAFHLPPLRERPGLIRPLASRWVLEFGQRKGTPVRSISVQAMQALESYSWPGNLRELRNVIERAVALCDGDEIGCPDLPEKMAATVPAAPEGSRNEQEPQTATLDQVRGQAESARIEEALRRHNNNRQRAAAELGISRMTLYNKLEKYGLGGQPPSPPPASSD
jgi:DNA-binding NtrC family response regulator